LIQLGQPLSVDKRLDNPPYFDHLPLPPQTADKTKLGDFIQSGIDLIDQLDFIAPGRKKNPDQFHHLVTGKNQARVAATGVKFGELLAQQRQQQTDRIRVLPPGHQPRDVVGTVLLLDIRFRT
jgi:hypothetical protein